MQKTFKLTINGKAQSVTTFPERSLLEVLREQFHLTGAKYGCGEGQCRACTVLVNGKAVVSCLTAVEEVDKATIQTIEGLSDGSKLHPLQQAFLDEGAFQCGYCTAGMILGAAALLHEKPHASRDDIVGRMQKHICRCCSYPRIAAAIERAAKSTT